MEIANYTTRKQYMQDYAKAHRLEINAKKREWRKQKKAERKLASITPLRCN